MSEILIKIEIDNNNDIKISNDKEKSSFTISYEKKYISAVSVYDVLAYKPGYVYRFEENGIDEKTDDKVKRYYNEIVGMLKRISDGVSALDIIDPDEDINAIDSLTDDETENSLPF